MRILVVQESDWIERGPHQQHHLMERLQRRGHDIRVIDYDITWRNRVRGSLISHRMVCEARGKDDGEARIQVIRPGMIKVPLLDYMSIPFTHGIEIDRQLREFDPDLVVGLGIVNAYVAMRLCRTYNKPFVYYLIDAPHTLIPEKGLRIFGKALESRILRSSDLVFVINRELETYVLGLGGSKERTIILGAGVDPNQLNPQLDGSSVREKYGIKLEEIVLFFMGWLYPFSGVREVAHSLMEYDGSQKLRLMVVGRGDIQGELRQMEQNGLGERLVLLDWQPYSEIPKHIAASDICLLPAYDNDVMRNIVPIKMYEYMACGKPVIATKLPGLMKEFGEDSGVVYVDRPDQALSLATELAKDRRNLNELGLKAASYVKKYSWQSLTDSFEKILDSLVLERKRWQ
jgi:glycosyltransferase involved in cell wall biosynthesis